MPAALQYVHQGGREHLPTFADPRSGLIVRSDDTTFLTRPDISLAELLEQCGMSRLMLVCRGAGADAVEDVSALLARGPLTPADAREQISRARTARKRERWHAGWLPGGILSKRSGLMSVLGACLVETVQPSLEQANNLIDHHREG